MQQKEKGLESLYAFLNYLSVAGNLFEILIYCLLANTYVFFLLFLRGLLVFLVWAARMLDIKETAKTETVFSKNHPVL